MLYTDINELKSILEIDPGDHSEDKKINFLIEQASQWIEELINRPGMSYKQRVEYYDGTGNQKLCLKSRPVYQTPTPIVYVDSSGYYGTASGSFSGNSNATPLTYGVDYTLKIDTDDGISKSGILIRINDYWNKRWSRQTGYLSPFISDDIGSIQVTYTAGYTVDTLPSAFRLAMNLLVAKMLYVFPLGMELGADSYEDKSISIIAEKKDYLLSLVKPILWNYRNWKW